MRNVVYADMHQFADVLVEVPPGGATATARRVPPQRSVSSQRLELGAAAIALTCTCPVRATGRTLRRQRSNPSGGSVRRPPAWMPYWRGLVLGVPTAVLVGVVDHVGPVGWFGSAAWLLANWWLY